MNTKQTAPMAECPRGLLQFRYGAAASVVERLLDPRGSYRQRSSEGMMLEILKRLFGQRPAEAPADQADLQAAQAGQQHAETGLRHSEEQFEQLVASVRDYAVFLLDPQGNIRTWNTGAEHIKGYRAEEIIGQHFSRLYPKEAVASGWPTHELQVAGVTGRFEDEGWRVRKDGTLFWASVVITTLRDEAGHVRGFLKITRDLTARKQAEENARRLAREEAARKTAEQYAREIEKQREQLHVTLSSIGDGVIVTDQDGRVTFMNPVAVGLTGWKEAEGQPLEDVFNIVNENTRKIVENPALRALREGNYVGLANHTVLIAKDGKEWPIDDCAAPIRVGQERAIGAVLVFRDVSRRRQTETALRDSERRFRQLADSMPQIVWTARPDGTIEYYNERWYEYTGFPRDRFEAENWGSILHPDDRQRAIDTYFGCIKDESPYEIEYRFKDRKTGGYRWFLGRAVPGRDEQGKVVRWYGTCTDIDDTKRAEEKSHFLAEASAQFSELNDPDSTLQKVAAVAVPAFADWCTVDVLDDNGAVRRLAIKHTDPSKVRLAEEVIQRYPPRPDATRGLRHVLATGKAEMMQEIPDALLLEGAQDSEHLRLLQELGLKSYICMPMQSHGRTLGALTFVMAESGRRFTSADMRLAEQLAQRAAVAIENANLYAALREEDRRKTEFLAVLAHELRNPLAPIRNGLQVMKLAGDDPQSREQARTMMERQLRHLVRLVDDLLDLNRISRGKIELRKEHVPLAAVVHSALETCEPLVKEQNDELTVTLPDDPLYVDADKTRLAQVIANLVSNAVKYSNPGSRIWLTVQREANEAVIRVKDTGVGIPSHLLPKVFDMFMQVDPPLERTQGGLGIGLAIVKRLVEMHGGAVEARSEGPGKGSEFLIRLPVVQPPAQERGGEVPSQPPRQTARYRILVADDNVDSADSLAMMLRLMGHEVRTAHDGLEAVEAAPEFRPEMILLDIGMPKLNGYDACRRIREQPWSKDAAIFALTGWGQEEDKRRSQEAGFNDHLVKPVELVTLEKLLAGLKA